MAVSISLMTLQLGANNIGDDGAKAFGAALAVNGSLTSLDLSNNNLAVETGYIRASKAQGSSFNVWNRVTYQGRKMTTSMGKNRDGYIQLIDFSGVKELASAIAVNGSLTSLNLYNNNIGNKGGKAIAKALAVNGSLTSLNLAQTGIGKEGSVVLAKALKVNSSLTSLDLRFNDIDKEATQLLENAAHARLTLST